MVFVIILYESHCLRRKLPHVVIYQRNKARGLFLLKQQTFKSHNTMMSTLQSLVKQLEIATWWPLDCGDFTTNKDLCNSSYYIKQKWWRIIHVYVWYSRKNDLFFTIESRPIHLIRTKHLDIFFYIFFASYKSHFEGF